MFSWKVLCALAISIALFGCDVGMPRQYYQVDLVIEINGREFPVSYNWHCWRVLDGPNFGPGNLIHIRWTNSDLPRVIARRISGDTVFLFPTISALLWCGADDGPINGSYSPVDITIVDSVANPTTLVVFDNHRFRSDTYTVKVKSGTLTRLTRIAPDYAPSQEEQSLVQALREHSHGFQSVSALITPSSLWGRSAAFSKYVQNATGILIAEPGVWPNGAKRDDGNNRFPVNQERIFAPIASGATYRDPLIFLAKENDMWSLFPGRDSQSAMMMYSVPVPTAGEKPQYYSIQFPPPVAVKYEGTLVPVRSSQQVFDTDRGLLISFSNSFQSLPWLE